MMRYVVLTLGAIAIIALLEAARQVYRYYDESRREELRRRLQALGSAEADGEGSLLKQRRLAKSPALSQILATFPIALRVEKLLEQTDTHFTVAQMLAWSVLSGCAGIVVALALHLGAILALAVAGAMACAPVLALLTLRGRRSGRISEQLPDALDMVARSLRAGHALSAALQVVAREMPEPVAVEFARVYETQRLGVALELALAEMSGRVPGNGDVNMLVVSATIQKETGGNLAEILSNLAETIRARYKFYGKLKALTAEGRASAVVVSLLPVIVLLVLQVLNPQYLVPLLKNPIGFAILAYAIVSWIGGIVWLHRMSRVQF